MNPEAAAVAAETYLKGIFSTLDSLLEGTSHFEAQPPEPAESGSLAQHAATTPIALQCRITPDVGAAVLLFSEAHAAALASLLRGTEPGEGLDDEGRTALQEAAQQLHAGAVASLGIDGAAAEEIQLLVLGEGGAEQLTELLGEEPTAVVLTYSVGEDLSGEAALLFSPQLEEKVPQEAGATDDGDEAPGVEATLSQDEMTDILSGFPAPDEMEEAPRSQGAVPGNIDMVLDIRLDATARLGSVEVPLGNILSLGPGSIIEIGHNVDEPIELLINGKLVARGDVVQIDERFGLRITEIISRQERIESLR